MRIRSIRHRGLRRFVEQDDARELPSSLVNRVRNVVAALIAAPSIEGVQGPPGWRIHQLAGDRLGTWSISLSGNWRIAFVSRDGELRDLNLEDYH